MILTGVSESCSSSYGRGSRQSLKHVSDAVARRTLTCAIASEGRVECCVFVALVPTVSCVFQMELSWLVCFFQICFSVNIVAVWDEGLSLIVFATVLCE